MFYGPSLEYGNEQSFSFSDTLTKEMKIVKSFYIKENYNLLCLLICYPLNPFVIVYAISIFINFLVDY